MSTNALKAKEITRSWRHFDAKNKILGRMASEIAIVLMGKDKPNFVPYLDNGDFVVVTNAKLIKVTGKKLSDKIYFNHSGYPGGDRKENLAALLGRRPSEVIRHAVWGMLPKGKLGRVMIKKLKVYGDSENPYKNQIKEAN